MHHNNGDICYEVHSGNLETPKSTVVFIHGFGLDKRQWGPQVDKLVEGGNRVITYDLRGFGESSIPSGPYSHTDDLEALLKTLTVESAVIVGHSFGGAVAIDFAAKKPGMAEGLILIASALGSFGVDRQSPIPRLRKLAQEGKMDEVRRELLAHESLDPLREHPEEFELVAQMLTDYSGWHFSHIDPGESTLEVAQELPEIKCPVQIIIGDKDTESSRAISAEIRRRLPNADFQSVENAGHFLNLEKPEVVTGVIESFAETHREVKEDMEIEAHPPGVEGGYSIG